MLWAGSVEMSRTFSLTLDNRMARLQLVRSAQATNTENITKIEPYSSNKYRHITRLDAHVRSDPYGLATRIQALYPPQVPGVSCWG